MGNSVEGGGMLGLEDLARQAGRAWGDREQSAQLDGSAGRYWEPTVYDAIGVLPDGIEAEDLYRLAGLALEAAKARAAELSAEFCAAMEPTRG